VNSLSHVRPKVGRPSFLEHDINICYDREINKILTKSNDGVF